MFTVTGRIKAVKQPYGGYLPVKDMNIIELKSENELHENENIQGTTIGTVVDYLSRFMLTRNEIENAGMEAFHISLIGARLAQKLPYAIMLLTSVKGLDDESIINACKLVGFDACYRAGHPYTPQNDPDTETIANIREMVKRSLLFFEEYGPITSHGFTFEGGYTETIVKGDGDFLTEKTLWDFKVLRGNLTKNHTLQLIIYWLMGQESIHSEFDSIENLGIFNPRKNTIYLYPTSNLSPETVSEIRMNVIGYTE